MLDAGIVDQDVDRPERRLGGLDHCGNLVGFGHVGSRIDCLDAKFLFDSGAFFIDLGRRAEAVDHDVGAVLSEGAGNGEADTGGRTGDDRISSFQHDPSCLVPVPSLGARASRPHQRKSGRDARAPRREGLRKCCSATSTPQGRGVQGIISSRQARAIA